METIANLFTGSNRIRLAAFTLSHAARVPVRSPVGPSSSRSRWPVRSCADSFASSHRWYEEFAEMLADRRNALDPPPVHDQTLHDVLRTAFDEARAQRRDDRLRKMLQMLWADELLEVQRQVQSDLADSAGIFARRSKHKQMI